MRFYRRRKKYILVCFLLFIFFLQLKSVDYGNDLIERLNRQSDKWNLFYGRPEQNISNTSVMETHGTTIKPIIRKCFRLTLDDTDMIEISNRSCNYITLASTEGRLGNHLFRVASLFGLAYTLDLVPVLQHVPIVTKYFHVPNIHKMKLLNSEKYVAPACCIYFNSSLTLDPKSNWTIHGYFQSWRYFIEAKHVIKDVLKLRPEYIDAAKKHVSSLGGNKTSSVCIHIRRRDMVLRSSILNGYISPGPEYIYKAIQNFRDLINGSVQFIVISDDMVWSKQFIKGDNITYSPFHDAGYDMALMTSCDHVIVTAGSYGWWGGWLAEGSVVYFTGFPGKGSRLERETNRVDYYPKDWIGLD